MDSAHENVIASLCPCSVTVRDRTLTFPKSTDFFQYICNPRLWSLLYTSVKLKKLGIEGECMRKDRNTLVPRKILIWTQSIYNLN